MAAKDKGTEEEIKIDGEENIENQSRFGRLRERLNMRRVFAGIDFSRVLKFIGACFLILFLAIAGFFAGIYLRVLDVHEINEKIDLYALPYIGEHFVKPADRMSREFVNSAGEFGTSVATSAGEIGETVATSAGEFGTFVANTVDEWMKDEPPPQPEETAQKKQDDPKKSETDAKQSGDQNDKSAQNEEQKRVSKLARLYNEMKPDAAAKIMADLDDEIAVAVLQKMDIGQAAKVMASFDPEQSARLTKIMYTGKRGSMYSPGDSMTPSRSGNSEE